MNKEDLENINEDIRVFFKDENTYYGGDKTDPKASKFLFNIKTWETHEYAEKSLMNALTVGLPEGEKKNIKDRLGQKTIEGNIQYLPYQNQKLKKSPPTWIINTYKPPAHFHQKKSENHKKCPEIIRDFIKCLFVTDSNVERILDWLSKALKEKNFIFQLWVDNGGTGKTFFINNCIKPLFGRQNVLDNLTQSDVKTSFNARLYQHQILNFNEINLSKEEHISYFKNLSEPEGQSEDKNVKRKSVPSSINVIITSNQKSGFDKAIGERRFDIRQMAEVKLKEQKGFFAKHYPRYDGKVTQDAIDYVKGKLRESSKKHFWDYLKYFHKIESDLYSGIQDEVKVNELDQEGNDWKYKLKYTFHDYLVEADIWEFTVKDFQIFLKNERKKDMEGIEDKDFIPVGWKKVRTYINESLSDLYKCLSNKPPHDGVKLKIERKS